jgi:formyltetrahydrofolate deformylase
MTSPVDSEADESAAGGKFVRAVRGRLPVKDLGRLLLRCADRPGLVTAVSTFLAGGGR